MSMRVLSLPPCAFYARCVAQATRACRLRPQPPTPPLPLSSEEASTQPTQAQEQEQDTSQGECLLVCVNGRWGQQRKGRL